MRYHVVEVNYIKDYIVWFKFKNGLSGEINFKNELDGKIFEPLKDKKYFKSFSLSGNTICWDNGADFAPEYLYEKISSKEKCQI